MKYTKKDLGSYNLHLIHTDKLKTITIRVIFHTPIKKEEITKRTLLTDILLQSSNKYPTRRDLTIQSEELYACNLSSNNQRLGNYIMTSFDLRVLMDKYTEENNLEKSIEFLSEVIFNPDIENNAFMDERLELVKHNALIAINSIKESPTSYSLLKMYEAYDKDNPVSYSILGYVPDLEKIDSKDLYDTYNKMINTDYVDIFVVGDFDNKEMLTTIKRYFKLKKIKKPKGDYYIKNKKPRKRRIFPKEEIDNSQSQLSILAPISKMNKYEQNYALVLGNIIFGGGVDSKLFREVREANSLCYTISSHIHKLDNMMIITAGIDRENYHKTVDLITKKLEEMKKGKFTNDDIKTAVEIYKSNLENIDENENKMINEYLFHEIIDTDDLETRLETISKVKKQDIVKAMKKITIDTVFMLEGVGNEKD